MMDIFSSINGVTPPPPPPPDRNRAKLVILGQLLIKAPVFFPKGRNAGVCHLPTHQWVLTSLERMVTLEKKIAKTA
jgi:hypothetical protein